LIPIDPLHRLYLRHLVYVLQPLYLLQLLCLLHPLYLQIGLVAPIALGRRHVRGKLPRGPAMWSRDWLLDGSF
jgi:hypothetical protein